MRTSHERRTRHNDAQRDSINSVWAPLAIKLTRPQVDTMAMRLHPIRFNIGTLWLVASVR